MEIQGKLIIEFAELDAMGRAEANSIKKVITSRVDRFRPPYARAARDFPRQCVFVGTTNEDNYLKDHTGARRFWPVSCGEIDIATISACREQLFAEALVKLNAGETWWEVPEEDAVAQQEARREVDVWESLVDNFLIGKSETTVNDIAQKCLEIEPSHLDRLSQCRIAKCLRSLGWRQVSNSGIDGGIERHAYFGRARVYRRL